MNATCRSDFNVKGSALNVVLEPSCIERSDIKVQTKDNWSCLLNNSSPSLLTCRHCSQDNVNGWKTTELSCLTTEPLLKHCLSRNYRLKPSNWSCSSKTALRLLKKKYNSLKLMFYREPVLCLQRLPRYSYVIRQEPVELESDLALSDNNYDKCDNNYDKSNILTKIAGSEDETSELLETARIFPDVKDDRFEEGAFEGNDVCLIDPRVMSLSKTLHSSRTGKKGIEKTFKYGSRDTVKHLKRKRDFSDVKSVRKKSPAWSKLKERKKEGNPRESAQNQTGVEVNKHLDSFPLFTTNSNMRNSISSFRIPRKSSKDSDDSDKHYEPPWRTSLDDKSNISNSSLQKSHKLLERCNSENMVHSYNFGDRTPLSELPKHSPVNGYSSTLQRDHESEYKSKVPSHKSAYIQYAFKTSRYQTCKTDKDSFDKYVVNGYTIDICPDSPAEVSMGSDTETEVEINEKSDNSETELDSNPVMDIPVSEAECTVAASEANDVSIPNISIEKEYVVPVISVKTKENDPSVYSTTKKNICNVSAVENLSSSCIRVAVESDSDLCVADECCPSEVNFAKTDCASDIKDAIDNAMVANGNGDKTISIANDSDYNSEVANENSENNTCGASDVVYKVEFANDSNDNTVGVVNGNSASSTKLINEDTESDVVDEVKLITPSVSESNVSAANQENDTNVSDTSSKISQSGLVTNGDSRPVTVSGTEDTASNTSCLNDPNNNTDENSASSTNFANGEIALSIRVMDKEEKSETKHDKNCTSVCEILCAETDIGSELCIDLKKFYEEMPRQNSSSEYEESKSDGIPKLEEVVDFDPDKAYIPSLLPPTLLAEGAINAGLVEDHAVVEFTVKNSEDVKNKTSDTCTILKRFDTCKGIANCTSGFKDDNDHNGRKQCNKRKEDKKAADVNNTVSLFVKEMASLAKNNSFRRCQSVIKTSEADTSENKEPQLDMHDIRERNSPDGNKVHNNSAKNNVKSDEGGNEDFNIFDRFCSYQEKRAGSCLTDICQGVEKVDSSSSILCEKGKKGCSTENVTCLYSESSNSKGGCKSKVNSVPHTKKMIKTEECSKHNKFTHSFKANNAEHNSESSKYKHSKSQETDRALDDNGDEESTNSLTQENSENIRPEIVDTLNSFKSKTQEQSATADISLETNMDHKIKKAERHKEKDKAAVIRTKGMLLDVSISVKFWYSQ